MMEVGGALCWRRRVALGSLALGLATLGSLALLGGPRMAWAASSPASSPPTGSSPTGSGAGGPSATLGSADAPMAYADAPMAYDDIAEGGVMAGTMAHIYISNWMDLHGIPPQSVTMLPVQQGVADDYRAVVVSFGLARTPGGNKRAFTLSVQIPMVAAGHYLFNIGRAANDVEVSTPVFQVAQSNMVALQQRQAIAHTQAAMRMAVDWQARGFGALAAAALLGAVALLVGDARRRRL